MDLYRKAFIHRSYVNENSSSKLNHNERLEFLGDAVLELSVTKYLFDAYPNKSEGELTNWRAALVRGVTLAKAANRLRLGEYLKLSKGEERSGGREKEVILAGTFEALVGAIYLDLGYDLADKFIGEQVISFLDKIIKENKYIDSKTFLQERTQDEYGITPTYEVVSESGPDHNKEFIVAVSLEEKEIATGKGTSKQKAQQDAASQAIENLDLDE
jgi:ribonuclease-3